MPPSYTVFFLRHDGRIATWHSTSEALFGFSIGEALGKPCAARIAGFPDDEAKVTRLLRTAQDFGFAEDEATLVRKGGSTFPAACHVLAMRRTPSRRADDVAGFVMSVNDKTAEKEVAEARERLLARERDARLQAEAARRLKDEFVATVSHELRTPLGAIYGWARLLRAGHVESPDVAFESIERNARSLSRLVEDLLDVSRLTTGKLRLENRQVDFTRLIRDAAQTVALAVEVKAIRIALDLGAEPVAVMGDPERLTQVLWNLLSNAVKFTPQGGEIVVVLRTVGDHATMSVSDDGEGIDPVFLPHVFERFRQGEAPGARVHAGLGLGLAIARELVEMHGGTIAVDSPGKNRGTVFTLRLPLTLNAPEIAPASPALAPSRVARRRRNEARQPESVS